MTLGLEATIRLEAVGSPDDDADDFTARDLCELGGYFDRARKVIGDLGFTA